MNTFLVYKWAVQYLGHTLTLRKYSLFIWNSNLTKHPISSCQPSTYQIFKSKRTFGNKLFKKIYILLPCLDKCTFITQISTPPSCLISSLYLQLPLSSRSLMCTCKDALIQTPSTPTANNHLLAIFGPRPWASGWTHHKEDSLRKRFI